MIMWVNCTVFDEVPSEAWEPLVYGTWIEDNGFDPQDFIVSKEGLGLQSTVVIRHTAAAVAYDSFLAAFLDEEDA